MHKRFRRTAGVLLALTGLHSLSAAAQVTSTATISNMRVVLTDLDLTDGMTPWFSFDDADAVSLSVSSAVLPTTESEQRDHAYGERHGYFTFSANTQVSLQVDADMAMQASASPAHMQYGSAWVAFLANATWGPPRDRWTRYDSEDDFRYVGLDPLGDYRTEVNRHLTLSLLFTNNTGYDASGEFRIIAESISYAMASPVPEPSAPAMFAAGTVILGLIGRRRKRASRQHVA